MNSSPASSQISRSSWAASARMRVADSSSRRVSSLTPAFSVSRSTRISGSSISVSRPPSPRSAICSRWRAASSATRPARCGLDVVRDDRDAALLGQLVEREAAPGGVEQEGGDLGVEGEVGRDLAERLGLVREHRPLAGGRDELGGVLDLADDRGAALRRSAAKRQPVSARQQLALGDVGRGGDERRAPRRAAWRRRRACPRAPRSCAPRPPRAAGSPPSRAAASASSSRRSGSRSSQSRNTGRTPERSTSRVISTSRSMSTGTSRTIVASCLDSRAASACSVRFCLRLAPEISSTLASTVSRSPKRCSRSDGRLVADARDAGDVVGGVALEPDEVRDQLRRDAVAVDHALAVVDLRVGHAAARAHDPHAVVDQLVGVAVARDDHHRDPALLGLLGERGDHVVGLVALDGDVAVAERLHQRAQVRPLELQQVRPARSAGPCSRARSPCARTCPASQTTTVGTGP